MNLLHQLRHFIIYKIKSKNKHGHGIHSPYIYSFVRNVLQDRTKYKEYKNIEVIRDKLEKNRNTLNIRDDGAGSQVFKTKSREINRLVRRSSVNKKFGRLLFRIIRSYKPQTIIELGTSLGISTMYMAAANQNAQVFTIESSRSLIAKAKENFRAAGLNNIELINNVFDQALPELSIHTEPPFFAFIDGNHRYEPTLNFFNILAQVADENCVIVIDDIYWSDEMTKAWKNICSDQRVKVSIDLFFAGIIFFRKGIAKQNFVINF